ncbi:DUF1850 domain-containing protein [Desertibacillus haloalkaliphilus]|nr:DUF1850 domain-containing protein [Desertibacillus haloalkaliphilus]
MTVEPGDHISVSWIHSVERTPWQETYKIVDNQQLELIETRFQSFGAGVPHESNGETTIEDGYTVMTGIDRVVEQFSWVHSHDADFQLFLNDENIIESYELPHHHQLEFHIEKR